MLCQVMLGYVTGIHIDFLTLFYSKYTEALSPKWVIGQQTCSIPAFLCWEASKSFRHEFWNVLRKTITNITPQNLTSCQVITEFKHAASLLTHRTLQGHIQGCLVQIVACRPATQTGAFRVFPQPFQAYARLVPQLGCNCFLLNPF
jgi:hypothetical protein